MSVVRQSNRLPQIATGPFAGRSTAARDGDWCEIEALLASTEPVSGGRRTSRALGRSLAGIAALIATGGLALAGFGAAERAGYPGQAARKPEMASTIMAVPPRTQVAGAPRAAIEEGRSVAAATPGTAASGASTDQPASTDVGPSPRPHRRKHREHRAALDRH